MNTQTTKFKVAFIALLIAMAALCPTVSAVIPTPPGDVYTAYAETTDHIGQVFKVWLTVDTRWDKITVRWEGHIFAVMWGFPGLAGPTGVSVWDMKGYSAPSEPTLFSTSGSVTFQSPPDNYANSYTWVYVKVTWPYAGAWWFFTVSCTAATYVRV